MSLGTLGSLLAALVMLLIGTLVNRRVALLSRYNIPDPITGGLLFALLAMVAWAAASFRLQIDQTVKPVLLLMFFAGVGMSADLRMLKRGGRALVLFLIVLFPYILVQDAVGVAIAKLLDLHPIFGLVGGSITLVGGHGTGAAYAERFAEVNNLQSVMELSMTVATIGLILGGIIAGPVAQYLITRFKLQSKAAAAMVAEEAAQASLISTVGLVGALAGILAAVIAGQWLAARLSGGAVTVPAFLWCMMLGVAIRNLLPFARIPTDDRASDLISGVCLSLLAASQTGWFLEKLKGGDVRGGFIARFSFWPAFEKRRFIAIPPEPDWRLGHDIVKRLHLLTVMQPQECRLAPGVQDRYTTWLERHERE
jgi:ESS family glutamate:Na+ symporter